MAEPSMNQKPWRVCGFPPLLDGATAALGLAAGFVPSTYTVSTLTFVLSVSGRRQKPSIVNRLAISSNWDLCIEGDGEEHLQEGQGRKPHDRASRCWGGPLIRSSSWPSWERAGKDLDCSRVWKWYFWGMTAASKPGV